MKTITKKALMYSTAIILLGVLLVLFFIQNRDQYEPQIYNVNAYLDIALGGNIERSVSHARDIVYGQYVKHDKQYHMGAQYWGDLYTFKVEDTLLGEAKGQIQVLIPHYRVLGEAIDENFYTANIPLANYLKPDMSKKYIIMLGYRENDNIYSPVVVPNHIELDDNDIAILRYNSNTTDSILSVRGDQINFTLESVDLTEYDEISGLSMDQIYEQVKKALLR